MSSDDKKDLTGIMEVARKMKEQGTFPDAPAGSVMEEQKFEKVDDFESLEEYGKTNPAADPPPEQTDFPVSEPASPATNPGIEFDANPSNGFTGLPAPEPHAPDQTQFPVTAPALDEGPLAGGGTDLSALGFAQTHSSQDPDLESITQDEALDLSSEPPEFQNEPEPLPPLSTTPVPDPIPLPTQPGNSTSFSQMGPDAHLPPKPDAPTEPPIKQTHLSDQQAPRSPMEKVRQFSDNINLGKASAPAAFPFSLRISGRLAPEEKARLLDIVSRENMGIREIDLEPQLDGDEVLIPRISEYAGVLLVSALRSAQVHMRLGPADEIYSALANREDTATEVALEDSGQRESHSSSANPNHPAERIPLTAADSLPGMLPHVVIDAVTASVSLRTLTVETENSSEYQNALEALQRELKYKAFRKGAQGIVNFSIQLTPLSMPTHYRLLLVGSAVRPVNAKDT